MAAVLEYITSEILEISGTLADESHKKRINNRHLLLAIQKDDELSKLFNGIVVN